MNSFARTLVCIFTSSVVTACGPSSPRGQGHLSSAPVASVDAGRVSVVGVSSGAFMAVQLGVAYSSVFKGVGAFAGGIYGCAEDTLVGAETCSNLPWLISSALFIEQARLASKVGSIDPVEGIRSEHVFIYAGTDDKTIQPTNAAKLAEFFRGLGAQQVVVKSLSGADHGMPTLSYGVPCNKSASPWLQSCGYDGAGAALNAFTENLKPPVAAPDSQLHEFDQKPYGAVAAKMAATGYVYIPKRCEGSSNTCSLVVALHGCEQSSDILGDEFSRHAGFNEWAEANGLVVLYPSVRKSLYNPKACWDWWGYTGHDYATHESPQMKSIVAMIRSFKQGPKQ